MTDADLDAMERALERRLRPWVALATGLVSRHLDDARAHAAKAITDRLRRSPDGRPSARRIEASPSYKAALGHLGALLAALVGPRSDSLTGVIRDARAAFYRDSVGLWTPHIDPEFRSVPDPVPTAAGEALMRGAIVHGLDLYREVSPAIEATKRELFVAVNAAGRRSATDRQGRDRLATWHARSLARLSRKAAEVLSDSDKAVHEATGILFVAEEYRGELNAVAGDGALHLPE